MINSKGEWIYTNAEIAYEIGVSPATINSVGKKLYGTVVPHWTIKNVRMILEYIKSISIEEDQKRLDLLRETVKDVGFEPDDLTDLAERVNKDAHLKKEQL